MAPKVTSSDVKSTVKKTNVKKAPAKKIDIAKEMMKFADENAGAIGKDRFQSP